MHDAYQGPGGPRRAVSGGANVANVAGTGAVFTGVSPRIEVVGLHYEVTPADLKVSRTSSLPRPSPLHSFQTI